MHLLDELTALNERLCQALQGGDVAAFAAGLVDREGLITALAAYGHPAHLTPDWMAYRITLAAQHQRLEAALARQQARLQEASGTFSRYHRARRSYRATPQAARILNKNLQG